MKVISLPSFIGIRKKVVDVLPTTKLWRCSLFWTQTLVEIYM